MAIQASNDGLRGMVMVDEMIKQCEVVGCDRKAGAILGRHDVCGDHYNEWLGSQNNLQGNEWFKRNILSKSTIKERIIDLLNKQCAKGEAKYNHTLDDCPDDKFDWKLMAMEELIDLVQYQQKEIMRLERLLNP